MPRCGLSLRLPLSVAGLLFLSMLPARLQAQQNPPAPELVASTDPLTPEAEKAAFRLPPGFEAQLVAAEPDIYKPMNMAFDSQGRLWVTSSIEYPFPPKPGEPTRDRLTILSDFGPDGRARSIQQFADDLNIPIGVLPVDPNEALVYSIPHILRLKDTNDDGKPDVREVAYEKFGFRDTHGMSSSYTWGFDGWVYATHGFSNTSEVKGADGQPVVMQSGNTYRFQTDGSHLEQWTWGQVNPFGLALDPRGYLYSSDCHSRPIYQLIRGAYYPSFGKPHDGLGFGPEMVTHDHGSTGIAGVVYYDADHFPAPYHGTVFIGNPVTSRINHDQIAWTGSSPTGVEQPDFLISNDPWFRPVDIELGPDGALYIADFYNKIIGHYEVPLTHPGRDRDRGRIWRIVYKGTDANAPAASLVQPNWSEMSIAELTQSLGHPNLASRFQAAHELVRRGPDASVSAVQDAYSSNDPTSRVHALWVLERFGRLDDARLIAALGDADPTVRLHAQRVLSDRTGLTDDFRSRILDGLSDADAHVQRAAAEALGLHPDASNLRPLLDLLHRVDPNDHHLRHVVRIAIRNQLRPDENWTRLPDPLSDFDRLSLAEVAPGVPSAAAAAFLLDFLTHNATSPDATARGIEHIARHGDDSVQPPLLTFIQSTQPEDLDLQANLLQAMHRGRQQRGTGLSPEALQYATDKVSALLNADRAELVQRGIELVGVFRLNELLPTLESLAERVETPEPQRISSLDALVALNAAEAIPTLGQLLATAEQPDGLRNRAAEALGQIDRPESREALLASLPLAPARLQRTIATALATTRPGAEALLEATAAGKASALILQEPAVQIRMNNAGVPDLEDRIQTLTASLPPADEAILARFDRRRAAVDAANRDNALDLEKGRALFDKTCGTCHQIGGKGAKIGPQLDGVGVRGLERLLEDVLDPNRNVDQAFRTTNLALVDGRIVSGLLLREEGDVLIVADAKGKEQAVPASDVEERQVVPLSPMPADIVEPLNDDEFAQLLGFLLSQRVTAPE